MFGIVRRRYGLKLGPRHAIWVESSRDWRGRSRLQHRVIGLPEGLLRPSPVELNISDPAALEAQLRALIGPGRKEGLSLVLVLPDLCARVALLEVEALPARPSEREALIRWRLEQESALPPMGCKVAARFFPPNTVLAVAVRETVLRQYEAVCEAVGLRPEEVGLAGLRLWSALADSVRDTEPIAMLSLFDDGFTLGIHHAGRPTFFRSKIRSGSGPEGSFHDLARSIAFYAESHPQALPHRVMLISEEPQPDLQRRITDELGLEVVPASGDTLGESDRSLQARAVPAAALPAVAGLHRAPAGINLSSARRSYLEAARVACVLLALLFAGLMVRDLQQARDLAAQVAEAEQALARVREQDSRTRLQAQSEGMDLSDAAMQRLPREVAFANHIIMQRAFSWTRFLSDLEGAVPPGIAIHSIRLDSKNAMIGLAGSALTLKDLTSLIIGLEDHRAFQDAVLGQHRVSEDGLVEFGLTVRYRNEPQGD